MIVEISFWEIILLVFLFYIFKLIIGLIGAYLSKRLFSKSLLKVDEFNKNLDEFKEMYGSVNMSNFDNGKGKKEPKDNTYFG